MSPRWVEEPEDGGRQAEWSVNADDSTLGDVLTSVDDGAGGKQAGWAKSAIDPGVASGTPGNWTHHSVTEDGGTFVLGAHTSATETLGVGRCRRNLSTRPYLRGQATVAVAGAITAYLDYRVSLDDGATWETDLLGIAVPLRAAKHAVGLPVQVPVAFAADVLLDPVVVGGDGVSVPEIKSFFIESTSAEPPPADGEGGPVTPGIPASATYYWALTEGSGQTVANKSPGTGGTANLFLGDTTGSDGSRDPTWQSSPRRLAFSNFLTVDCSYTQFGPIPSLAAGSALFFYADITSIGGLDKAFAGVVGATNDHRVQVSTGNKIVVTVVENTGGGTTRQVVSATAIANGGKYLIGYVHDGTNLKVYINPTTGAPDATAACAAALEPGGRTLIFGAAAKPTTTTGLVALDSWAGGDPVFFAGAVAGSLTADDIAGLYQQFKTIYSALP